MSILFNKQAGIFKLDALDTSYIIGIFDDEKFVSHLYYGKKIIDSDVNYLYGPLYQVRPSVLPGQAGRIMDAIPFEYPTYGCGDYREHCLEVETIDGYHACDLRYESHRIYQGKPSLNGLPSTFEKEDGDCSTLELVCRDKTLNLKVTLLYTTFEHLNVITRSALITNENEETVYIKRAMSGCLEFDRQNFDVLTLHGSWERECGPVRTPLRQGKVTTGSTRGESGPTDNPFLAALARDTTEETGEVFAMNLVYSGNFLGVAEGHHFRGSRIVMGINPVNFSWKLGQGETFTAPEVVMVYSDQGLGKMSRTFHDLYRRHLIRDVYPDMPRPILINNWEATYFNFTGEKLIEIAKQAKTLGIELFAMDDGWFGNRQNDDAALGDWFPNEEKLGCTLKELAERITAEGMQFGIWLEPEGISEDSDLYRSHPDWVVGAPGRKPCLSRCQWILDFSRTDVQDYMIERICNLLDGIPVSFVKWDCNRAICDKYSGMLDSSRQGEFAHRYVLGLYRVLEKLTEKFPEILFEGCGGGGGRFDAGMLYYTPQLWGSDTTDAIERLSIQYGASFGYPVSAMGTHVSMVPNHQTGRVTPLSTRGCVAMAGMFGYELDISKLSAEEKAEIKEQIALYKKYSDLIQNGDYYRISSPLEGMCTVWEIAHPSGKEALVSAVYHHVQANPAPIRVKVQGLNDEASYQLSLTENFKENYPNRRLPYGFGAGETITGAALKQVGFVVPEAANGFQAWQIYICAK